MYDDIDDMIEDADESSMFKLAAASFIYVAIMMKTAFACLFIKQHVVVMSLEIGALLTLAVGLVCLIMALRGQDEDLPDEG